MYVGFQSTHPHGVRPLPLRITPLQTGSFNPRTHTGCDPFSDTSYTGYNKFQSTHPHGVRLSLMIFSASIYHVSIHAPTRGATVPNPQHHSIDMFQSTHPHGVRLASNCDKDIWTLFQSTHPHGVRQIIDGGGGGTIAGFNPRTHTGCDNRYSGLAISVHKFQSTHPHGVRPTGHIIHPVIRLFQSTHPHGVRPSSGGSSRS